MFRYFCLPLTFKELAIVAERFHIKPLLPLFTEDEVFYLLALSQNQSRLLQCTRFSSIDVTLESIPESLAEALKYDQPEKQHQLHTTGPNGSAIHHGHGVSKDYDKDAILRYFRKVNRALHDLLKEEHAPLILAAVDYLHPIYKEANSYRFLLQGGIAGNPDEESDETLRDKGWKLLEPYIDKYKHDNLDLFNKAINKGMATHNLEEGIIAAYDGRVSTLLIAKGVTHWGRFDLKSHNVEIFQEQETGAEDLVNLVAFHTLVNGGKVYSIEGNMMPLGAKIAAIFRY
jgi:hypothetical protein